MAPKLPPTLLLLAALGLCRPARAQPTWTFDAGPEGFEAAHCLSFSQGTPGLLSGSLACADPYLLSPPFSADAGSFGWVRLAMRTDYGDGAQIFFSSSASPGIGPANRQSFALPSDGRFHVLDVPVGAVPTWAGTVSRLRLDPAEEQTSGSFELDWIALAGVPFLGDLYFDRPADALGITPGPAVADLGVAGGELCGTVLGDAGIDPWIELPEGLPIDAAVHRTAVVRLRVAGAPGLETATLYFRTAGDAGWAEERSASAPIKADGSLETLVLPLHTNPLWRGDIVQLRLDPLQGSPAAASFCVQSVGFGPQLGFDGRDLHGLAPSADVEALVAVAGALRGRIQGPDPFLAAPLRTRLDAFPALAIRLRADASIQPCAGSIYFGTTLTPLSGDTRVDFPAICDGSPHTLVVPMAAKPAWTGGLTALRIDPPSGAASLGTTFELDFLRFLPSGCDPVLLGVKAPDLAVAGHDIPVRVRVRNLGAGACQGASLSLFTPGIPGATALGLSLPKLPAYGEHEAVFTVQSPTCADASVKVELSHPSLDAPREMTAPLRILAPAPGAEEAALAALVPNGDGMKVENDWAAFWHQRIAAVFPRDACHGFGALRVYAWDPALSAWRPAGGSPSISAFGPAAAGGADAGSAGASAADLDWITFDQAKAQPFFGCLDLSGGRPGLGLAARICKGDLPTSLEVTGILTALGIAQVSSFLPVVYRPGEGAFGDAKDEAILGGLEYLGPGERSSSDRDQMAPGHLRIIPNPVKVALPVAEVRSGDLVTGLLWDPLQSWTSSGTFRQPSVVFASPDFVSGRAGHLTGLLLPPVGIWRGENAWKASSPFPLFSNGQVFATAQIHAEIASDVSVAAERWLDAFGAPGPTLPGGSTALAISVEAYKSVAWSAADKGWSHALGLQAEPYPCLVALARWAGLVRSDAGLLDRAALALPGALQRFGEQGLWKGDGCGVLEGEAPFLLGRIHEAFAGWELSMVGTVSRQLPDGSFGYSGDPAFGLEGEVNLGTIASKARSLLRFARITGSPDFRAQALSALEALRARRIPRGLQTSELPAHAPDLLAVAWGVDAFVNGFDLTGDPKWIQAAADLARRALPFLYTWQVEGVQAGVTPWASIPSFGASFYTASWFGRPVQRTGLVLMRALGRLAEHDGSFDWPLVQEGLLASALAQQYGPGWPQEGTYPDAFDLVRNERRAPDLQPEMILLELLAREGDDLRVRTARIDLPEGSSVYVSGIGVEQAELILDLPPRLKLTRRFPSGAAGYLSLSPLPSAPTEVLADAQPLGEQAQLYGGSTGWRYKDGILAIGLGGTGATQTLELRFDDADWDGDGSAGAADCQPFEPRAYAGATEVCDGIDNDCNSETDEGFGPISCGKGPCANTVPSCVAGTPQVCTPLDLGVDEVCNGLDDDCDGEADELADLGLLSCGLGICAKTVPACVGGLQNTCDPFAESTDESCNHLDDDCDGETDEETELGQIACGVGICARLVPACPGGQPGVCTPGQPLPAELCNGLDDDCNGQTDETFETVGEPCSAGTGVCARQGEIACDPVKEALVCDALPGDPAGPEACNGLDDDCNGKTDETFPFLGTACTKGTGDCQATGTIVCSDDATGTRCDAAIPSSPELCNGLDDDCNGKTDEGFPTVGEACTSGRGVCARPGLVICAPDGTEAICDAEPGPPATDDACNGLDDDCDGETDEGLPDLDGDGIRDECDRDRDGDTVLDLLDNCPATPNPDQADRDEDGEGDACDTSFPVGPDATGSPRDAASHPDAGPETPPPSEGSTSSGGCTTGPAHPGGPPPLPLALALLLLLALRIAGRESRPVSKSETRSHAGPVYPHPSPAGAEVRSARSETARPPPAERSAAAPRTRAGWCPG